MAFHTTMSGPGVMALSAVAVAAALVLPACGSENDATDFPTGRFVDQRSDTWVFQFNEDGTWAYFFGDLEAPEVEGEYDANEDYYIELTNSDAACPFEATYSWTFDGVNLTFELSGEDSCGEPRDAYESTFAKTD